MIINHNLLAQNSHRQMGINTANQAKSTEKLASGLRINRAGDDAAGLAISEKMRGQIRGLDQASRNAQDGISLIQTAEGALNETHAILQRMRELADQSANGTNTADDRKALQDEIKQLKDEIDRIGNTTEFNTQKLLNGNLKSAAGASVGQNTTVSAIIGKLTNGSTTAGATMSAATNKATAGDFVAETLTIDGTEITVNWQNLSDAEKNILKSVTTDASAQQAAKDLIINKINEAIDASGKNVAHVSGYVSNGTLTIESGSKGTDSIVKAGTAGVLSKVLSGGTPATGTNTYNGSAIPTGTKINFKVGELNLQATLATIAAGTNMDAVATALQTAIKTAVDAYNSSVGATSEADPGFVKEIKVNALKDGRLEVVSETGPVSFSDLPGGTAVRDLGLSQAQTDSSSGGGMTFQIGANKGQTITFGINDMRSAALGISGVDISTAAGAQNALSTLDNAIKAVSAERSKLGAVQNRLEYTINNLNTSSENLTAAESRIRDTDMAKTVMANTKNSILAQAAQAMLAQANQQPQQVLQLLR